MRSFRLLPAAVLAGASFQATVDLRATGNHQVQQVVWERSGLTRAQHTIRIVNRGTSAGMIDAYRITP
ncbi:hypothetical protein ACSHWB_41245 [Lentzea sp. HUAS TT2]|uniref:hypothetical protein n=1 Tax=Lentzea sp. HUAS TT2 TaxID=3447454 RepID=UPI003F70835E